MSNAKQLTNTWQFFTKRDKKIQVKHLINNCQDLVIHKINKFLIFKMNNHIEVVNSESLFLFFFDTEKEAINHCLDKFENSSINIQEKIF